MVILVREYGDGKSELLAYKGTKENCDLGSRF